MIMMIYISYFTLFFVTLTNGAMIQYWPGPARPQYPHYPLSITTERPQTTAAIGKPAEPVRLRQDSRLREPRREHTAAEYERVTTQATQTTRANGKNTTLTTATGVTTTDLATKATKLPRLAVVFDLDETLIHSHLVDLNQSAEDIDLIVTKCDEDNDCFKLLYMPRGGEETFTVRKQLGIPKLEEFVAHDEIYLVQKRPGLDAFLATVSKKYDLCYADAVINEIDTNSYFPNESRYYRNHCQTLTFSSADGQEFVAYGKDLLVIKRNLKNPNPNPLFPFSRIVLVDNKEISFFARPGNGILIKDFIDDKNDFELMILIDALNDIDNCDNVEHRANNLFQMKRQEKHEKLEKHENHEKRKDKKRKEEAKMTLRQEQESKKKARAANILEMMLEPLDV